MRAAATASSSSWARAWREPPGASASRRSPRLSVPPMTCTSTSQQAIVKNVQREELNPLERRRRTSSLSRIFVTDARRRRGRSGRAGRRRRSRRAAPAPPSIQRSLKERGARMGHACWRCSAHPTAPFRNSSPSVRSPRTFRCARSRRRSGTVRSRSRPNRRRRARPSSGRRVSSSSRSSSATTSRRGCGSRSSPASWACGGRVRNPRGPRADLPDHHRGNRPQG